MWQDLRTFFVGPSEEDLPDRLRQAIFDQQDRGERLTGWIQLAVVLLWGSLWAISPKMASGYAALPVPAALFIYFVLTVIRIVWSYRSRLPAWSLAISVVFDMALLLTVIWSFHLTYDQPPSFFLKAPTLLYIFIFIALRGLRFDSRFVLLAGAVAALGWAAMVGYVVVLEAASMPVTRDYIVYMTSNSLLFGAEFDKIITILIFTLILAVALARAKALLLRSVVEEQKAKALSRFFDEGVAERIKSAEREIVAGQAEQRNAAILSLDLRSFTPLAASQPAEETVALLSAYQSLAVPIIHRHGGAVDKFLGDGILASFGAVEETETYAADALRALEEIMAEAAGWQAERRSAGLAAPEVNAALASGQVLFGVIGEMERLEYTVIGEPVNLAAKLEKENKRLRTRAVSDTATLALAERQGYRGQREAPRLLPAAYSPEAGGEVDLVVLTE
ncbi:MAG: adenylate/guanylate cyclase domain-containing protein [Rhodospirillales bacterium]